MSFSSRNSFFCSNWTPLPYRENEILNIYRFIVSSFESESPMVLSVCGETGCGKTSTVKLCSMMSDFSDRIEYHENMDENYIIDWINDDHRKLIIIDRPKSVLIIPLITESVISNKSLIVITEKPIKYTHLEGVSLNYISFRSYRYEEIRAIFFELFGSFKYCFDNQSIDYVSQIVTFNGLPLRTGIECVNISIKQLRSSKKKKIDHEMIRAIVEKIVLE